MTPKAVLIFRDPATYDWAVAFLSSFVMVALMLQVVTLVLLAIVMGSQALHRGVLGLWDKMNGRTPNPGH